MGSPHPQCVHNCTYNPPISTKAEDRTIQQTLAMIAAAISNISHL